MGDVVVFGDENSDVYIDFKKRYPNAWVKFANEDYYTSENLTELLNENVHTVLFDEEYIDIALDETGFRKMYEWASEVRTDYSFQMFCSKKCLYTAYTQQKKGISIGMLYDDKTKTLMINDQFYLYENDFKDGETDEYLNSSTLLLEDPYSVETIKYTPFGVPKRVFYNGAGNVCEVMPPTSRSETYAIEISYYWPHVKNVYFSDTVSAIAGVYFKKCNELENVVGKNIIYVAAKTFEETEADEINFENLEVIQTYAFYKSTIRNFVAKHIDTVYESAFKKCNVEHIDLSHILYLYSEAFLNCKIKEVVLGRIDEIPVSAFEGSSVEKVDLTNVESVGSRAFAYANIQELVIPNECESIGKYAFEHNNIKKLVFEKRSTKLFIEERAFAYNEIENDITIDGDIMQCDAACFYNNKIKRVTLSNVSTIKHTLFSDN